MITHPSHRGSGRRATASNEQWSPDALAQQAIRYLAWGLCPIPLIDKRPACRWKRFQYRRPSECQIGRLFSPNRRINGVGVVVGWVSGGLVTRDFDDPDAYHRWAREHPALAAAAPTVRSGRGFHVHVRTPPGTGEVYRRFSDGEVIGTSSHYVAFPPSQHPNGRLYEWVTDSGDIEPFPLLPIGGTGFLPAQPAKCIARTPAESRKRRIRAVSVSL